MSKPKSTKKGDKLDASSKSDLWDVAIADAERMIGHLNGQIRHLRQSVEAFKSLKASGAPFPGSAVVGQLKDL